MAQLTKKSFQKLYEIAETQQGFFTTKQAKASGYAENTHPYHVYKGNWLREQRGVYRLVNFPASKESDLIIWSLWSCNRQEIPQGVYSHETALSIHDLSDIMPSKLHMTVPQTFRRSKIPEIIILHQALLQETDIEPRQGFQVTTPLRTIADLLAEETVTVDIIKQALGEAIEKGLITRGILKKTQIPQVVQDKMNTLFREVGW